MFVLVLSPHQTAETLFIMTAGVCIKIQITVCRYSLKSHVCLQCRVMLETLKLGYSHFPVLACITQPPFKFCSAAQHTRHLIPVPKMCTLPFLCLHLCCAVQLIFMFLIILHRDKKYWNLNETVAS
jgi:hypothetical protein